MLERQDYARQPDKASSLFDAVNKAAREPKGQQVFLLNGQELVS